MSEQFVTTTKHFRKLLAAGYLLIVLLVGGIICTWFGEWRDLELRERENREINRFRKETRCVCGCGGIVTFGRVGAGMGR